MLELFILLASFLVGVFIVVAVAAKILVILFKLGFWALLLPFKIAGGILAALFSLLLGVVLPILLLAGLMGAVVLLPVLLMLAIPCILLGLGICLLVFG